MTRKMKENKIIELSDRDWVLIRPGVMLGSVDNKEEELLLFNEDSKLEYQKVNYVPALYKMINEILDNSIDEAVRTNFKFATNIKVTISDTTVVVEDDGRGVPLDSVEIAFTKLRAGTNFSEETRAESSIGTNGVGSAIVNIFSESFIITSFVGTKACELACYDNMGKINEVKFFKTKKRNGTVVVFKPDLERLGVERIDETYIKLLSYRLFNISQNFDINFELINTIPKMESLF